ncbi:reverse transcriptase domain protein [Colletotrichum musicola]|uniref:Reverse transcriptase domain protein n=1 Tax=Colletotrichum musicola TaxID=2175873 RepID=A0A8H6IMV7_9PEZI|nr:reverse transcriptase domain protein [Colletotrichum musicola]
MHRRLIHAHVSRVVEACRRIGITFPRSEIEAFHCEACHLAKSTEIISRDKPLPLTQIGEEIYVDVIEVKPLSRTKKRCVLHFLDRYSGYHWIVFLSSHDYGVVLDAVKHFEAKFTNLTGLTIKTWRTDNAPELKKVFRDPYFAHTWLDLTTAYTPSMNGSVERAGRTIVEAARTQLIESGLGEDLWDYSVDSTIQILNLLPSMSKGKLSPYEIMARELNLDVDQPDIAIPYAVAKSDETSSSDEADTTDKADKQIEITLMSLPPEDMDSSESQNSGITTHEDMYTDAQ